MAGLVWTPRPEHQLLYDPREGPMRVAAFASGSGTNFAQLLEESRLSGSNFSIDVLVTDRRKKGGDVIRAIGIAEEAGIPVITVRGRDFFTVSYRDAQESPDAMERYIACAEEHNAAILGELEQFERGKGEGYTLDHAALAGYMKIVRGVLLARFENKMTNVHPADLALLKPGGERKYVGDNAVFDALSDGQPRTRSCVLLVDKGTDTGPLLASGPWIPYEGPGPVTQDSADEHQEVQKRRSDWPVFRFVMRGIAVGNYALHKTEKNEGNIPKVVHGGWILPYAGYRWTPIS